MLAFATRMLRDKYKTFIAYTVSIVALLEMYVALFPSISQQSEQIDQMIQTMPAEFFKAMNMDISSFTFSSLESYLSTEYMSFLWPILAIIFAISLANYISVREIDKGTIEVASSLPVSRSNIIIQRYLMGLLILAGFSLISQFATVPLAMMHGIDFVFENYLTASIGSFFFIWAVYSLATLCSVMFSEKGRATTVASSTLVLMYVLNVVAGLKDNLSGLQYVSIFHYFNGPELLSKNVYSDYALLVLGGAAVILTAIAVYWFNKRDLSV